MSGKGTTKTKLKEEKGKGNDNEDPEDIDFALLRKPIHTSLNGFGQARKIFDLMTKELKSLLSNECDLLYECKVCRSMFRSLANFISHKRVYCKENFSILTHGKFRSTHCYKSEIRKINQVEKSYQECVNENSNIKHDSGDDDDRIPMSKDLTEVIEKVTKVKGINIDSIDTQHVTLQKIPNNSVAVYQNISFNKNIETDSMKMQVKELDDILSKNKAVLQSDGKFKIQSAVKLDEQNAEAVIQISDEEEDGGELRCKICDVQFSTQKTLKYHMKCIHVEARLVYPCPDCLDIFSTSWSVFRHLYKVHRKTAAQIKKLRESIQAKAFKMNNPPAFYEKRKNNAKAAVPQKITEEERLDQENQEWMDNMEGDGSSPRCGGCGRTFERRAALVAHTNTCSMRTRALARAASKKLDAATRKEVGKGPAAVAEDKSQEQSEDNPKKIVKGAGSDIDDYDNDTQDVDMEDQSKLEKHAVIPNNDEQDSQNSQENTVKKYDEQDSQNSQEDTVKKYDEQDSQNSKEDTVKKYDEQDKQNSQEDTVKKYDEQDSQNSPEVTVKKYDEQASQMSSEEDTVEKYDERGSQISPEDTVKKYPAAPLSNPLAYIPPVNLPGHHNIEKSNFLMFKSIADRDIDFKQMKCKKCNYKSEEVSKLYSHMADHLKWLRYECKFCTYKHYEFSKLPEHFKTVHKMKGNKDMYFSAVKVIEAVQALEMSDRSGLAEKSENSNEASHNSRRLSQNSSDSGRLSDDSSSSSVNIEKTSRKRKSVPVKSTIGKKRKEISTNETMYVDPDEVDIEATSFRGFDENSSDMEELDTKKTDHISLVGTRRPVRKKTRVQNDDFEYDLSNLLRKESQGYKDIQSPLTVKINQTKKDKKPATEENLFDSLNKDCTGALCMLSKKAVVSKVAQMKMTEFVTNRGDKDKRSLIFARPLAPRTFSRIDKSSPRKETSVLTDDNNKTVKDNVSNSSNKNVGLKSPLEKAVNEVGAETVTLTNNALTKDEKNATNNESTVTVVDAAKISLKIQNSMTKAAVQSFQKEPFNPTKIEPLPWKLNIKKSLQAKTETVIKPQLQIGPIKLRKESLDLIKNPLINKNVTDFSTVSLHKVLVIKAMNKSKDGPNAKTNLLKFQTVTLKDSNQSIENISSDKMVMVKMPSVERVHAVTNDVTNDDEKLNMEPKVQEIIPKESVPSVGAEVETSEQQLQVTSDNLDVGPSNKSPRETCNVPSTVETESCLITLVKESVAEN